MKAPNGTTLSGRTGGCTLRYQLACLPRNGWRLRRQRFLQPASQHREPGVVLAKGTIKQIPGALLRHRDRERRDQPAFGEILLDIGPQADRHAYAVDRRLQRHGVVAEGRPQHFSMWLDPGSGEPEIPILRRVRHLQHVLPRQLRWMRDPFGNRLGADWKQIGREQKFGLVARPVTLAEQDAAGPVVAERIRRASGRETDVDFRVLLVETAQ